MADVGDGPPAVLLHGLLGSPALPAAAGAGRGRVGRTACWFPGCPGTGRATAWEPFTFEGAADLLAAAVAQLGTTRSPPCSASSFGAPRWP